MRRLTTFILSTICTTTAWCQSVTYNPSCTSNISAFTIEKIEITPTGTVVNMNCYTTSSNLSFFLPSGMYIQEYGATAGKKYYIKEFVSNELNTKYRVEAFKTYKFTWLFEKIPAGINRINILEPVAEGYTSWYWKNIPINNYSQKQSNAGQKAYEIKRYTYSGETVSLYCFRMGGSVKSKYFAQNAFTRYNSWKFNNEILLVCSGAFSETWDPDSRPVGFTVDNGNVVNASMDRTMDGLVFVMENVVQAIDLDYLQSGLELSDGTTLMLDPRNSVGDRIKIKNLAIDNDYTIFQTQLVYSKDNPPASDNLTYGKTRERRFLALCEKDDNVFNVVVDAPSALFLNQSAKNAKEVLEFAGFRVHYILNLDTGNKNICLAKNGSEIVNVGDDPIETATNLLIFYK